MPRRPLLLFRLFLRSLPALACLLGLVSGTRAQPCATGLADAYLDVNDVRALGRRVATLAAGDYAAGWHELVWEANGVAGGVYFCRIEAGPHRAVRKMVLLR